MNKDKRSIYREIADVGELGLCHFCKYSKWYGNCCDSELECQHDLPMINGTNTKNEDHPDEVWAGDADCWGFRPCYDLNTCAIITSIWHDGNIPHLGRGNEWIAIIPKEDIQ